MRAHYKIAMAVLGMLLSAPCSALQNDSTRCSELLKLQGITGDGTAEYGFCFVPAQCPGIAEKIRACGHAVARMQLNRILAADGGGDTLHVFLTIPEFEDRLAFVGLPADLRPGFLKSRFPAMTGQDESRSLLAIDEAVENCLACDACLVMSVPRVEVKAPVPILLTHSKP